MAEASIPEAPIWDSIESFDGRPWRGLVHIVSAGDPCQPWSHAGQRKGYDDERVVFDDVTRIVSEVEPEFVFLENVAGAIDFRYDCKAVLEGMGYRVEAGLFSAAEVGAPHGRLRIFLLGNRRRERCDSRIAGIEEVERERRRRLGGAGGELAHSKSRCRPPGAGAEGQLRCATLAESGGELQHPPHDTAIEGLSLAHACESGCEERWRPRLSGEETSGINQGSTANRNSSLPLWPPRPNDLEAWREVLEETRENGPCVKPSIRRMANWMAYRVERLQMLGNGVVPLTAALAFRTLWGRLCDPNKEEGA
jgi:DNA (cytosine-5)-methyltransferase 1